jgi:hypothetical protein
LQSQLRAFWEVAQKLISGEVSQMPFDISGLQALAADHVSPRDVEATHQETKAQMTALHSEVGELGRAQIWRTGLLRELS